MRVLKKCLELQRVTDTDKKIAVREPTVRVGRRGRKKSFDVTVLQSESER